MKQIYFLFFAFSIMHAQQAPEIEWAMCYGGSYQDGANDVKGTFDGGFVVAGYANSNDGDVTGNHGYNSADYWILKFNVDGEMEWSKCYGGTSSDSPFEILQTFDGGYAIAGYTASLNGDVGYNNGGQDYWILKIDQIGNIEWEISLGGSSNDHAYSIQQTIDGGYIVAGVTESTNGDITDDENGAIRDYWVVKLSSDGFIDWAKTYALNHETVNEARIIQSQNGGYIIVGYTVDWECWAIKIDYEGSIEWQQLYTQGDEFGVYSIVQAMDGNYYIAGRGMYYEHPDYKGGRDFRIMKIDANGNFQWDKFYGGSNDDHAYDIKQTSDGNFIVVGTSKSDNGDVTEHHGTTNYYDYWVIKINAQGDLLWEKSLGGSYDDIGYSIDQTSNNGYVIVGRSNSFDGDVEGQHGTGDVWIIKLNPDQMSTSEINPTQIVIYPNPVKDILHFSEKLNNIEVYSLSGSKLLQATNKQSINVNHLPSGTYFLKAKDEIGKTVNLKFIKS